MPTVTPCTLPLGVCSSGMVGAGVQSPARGTTTFLSQDHLVTSQSSGDPAKLFLQHRRCDFEKPHHDLHCKAMPTSGLGFEGVTVV